MALRRRVQLNPASNVAVNSVATFDIPVDRRYHAIWLEYRNTGTGVLKTQALIQAEITRIDVLLNGIVVRSLKPAWIAAICALKNFALQDGYLPIFFSEPWMRDVGSEDAGAWSLRGNVKTFQINVVLGAAVNPGLKGMSEDDEVQSPFVIMKTTQLRPAVAGVGITTLGNFPTVGLYRNLYCFETVANDIKSVRVKLDNKELYYLTRDQANILSRRYGQAPQAGLFPVQFDGVNRWDHAIPTNSNDTSGFLNGAAYAATLEFDMANANTFDMLAEFVTNRI